MARKRSVDSDMIGGKPRVKGTRVSVEQIYEMYKVRKMGPEEIADVLSTVSESEVEAAVDYAEKHDISASVVVPKREIGKAYDTTLALKGSLFNAMEAGEKTIEIRNRRRGIHEGDVIRFTKGYNPEHGSLVRRVVEVDEKNVLNVTVRELIAAQVRNLPWLLDYADGDVFLFHLEELSKKPKEGEN